MNYARNVDGLYPNGYASQDKAGESLTQQPYLLLVGWQRLLRLALGAPVRCLQNLGHLGKTPIMHDLSQGL